ncbi:MULTISPECIES: hypothetical protein [Actinomycetes]|uniref:hypothetical protein n=1 Tax=Actinomycetes TaxID=1760 RepID=UPI0033E02968
MAFRSTIPLAELREKRPDTADDSRHETTYQASRGGWYPAPDKPVPGTPKESR